MSMAQARRLRHRCTIARVNQDNLDRRITMLRDWPCSPLYSLGTQERERWDMTTTTRAYRTYIKPSANVRVEQRMRFIIDSHDYRIVAATPVPASGQPHVIELVIDDEGL